MYQDLLEARKLVGPERRMAEAAVIRSNFCKEKGSLRTKNGTPVLERFFGKIAFGSSTCWYWMAFICPLGYGIFLANGENKAHRVAYRLFKGNIPEGMKVMHTCDTRCCVNPEHLVLGTQAENVADMMRKGRNKSKSSFGESNPMAKATRAIVDAIRAEVSAGASQSSMSEKYKLSKMAVNRIVRKESWK